MVRSWLSILCVVSKILERAVYSQLEAFVTKIISFMNFSLDFAETFQRIPVSYISQII